MSENIVYDDSMLKSMNLNSDDITISTKNLTIIINLCNDIAKKIKEQVLDTIEHHIDSASPVNFNNETR
ncbi:unnamed protein product [Rotaria sordida]|uniref:Uncharacterized protein n=1 Tax=Rotaria sordida TaxID=392033 RepID=A0A818T8B8_9BILA|nr:unnamed protein product [Rotaria sordida]CAF1379026.1 unnamed protein product [Rotaria sordida]CAF3679387.1 unnamed protein product [Rotaria sordida]CAF3849212.1 unnamed protein product [Rotaria sordida]